MTIPVDGMVKAYARIRDKRAELKAAFDAEDKDLQAKLDKVKQGLLEYCKEHGVESVRTQHGLFYRTVKTRYWTGDWESMHKFIMEHAVPEFFEKRLNQSAVKEFLEANPELLPPGLNVDAEYSVSVRKA
jgi:aspartate/tyrosine/aromatic aminotransferase